jgi:hypothetical protein
VWEWNEDIAQSFGHRVIAGGGYGSDPADFASSADVSFTATSEASFTGIRLANVGSPPPPESDTDADGIPDVLDKCVLDSRNAAATCDTDQDGYGNVCDGDFNQSQVVNTIDATPATILPPYPITPTPNGNDMDCSGVVNADDYTMFFVPNFVAGGPGPSGLCCAGTPPCN